MIKQTHRSTVGYRRQPGRRRLAPVGDCRVVSNYENAIPTFLRLHLCEAGCLCVSLQRHPAFIGLRSDYRCPAGRVGRLLFHYFHHFVALTHDVEAVDGVVDANTLEVEVFYGSVFVDFNACDA